MICRTLYGNLYTEINEVNNFKNIFNLEVWIMFEIIPFSRRSFLSDPFRAFDDMERSFFNSDLHEFRTDVTEDDNAYQISAELPGFKKEDINLDVEGDYLTISASHSEENEESDEKKNYIKRERFYGSYSRSFDITGVDVDSIKAEYNDGILKIDLPKVIPVAPATRRLEIQ